MRGEDEGKWHESLVAMNLDGTFEKDKHLCLCYYDKASISGFKKLLMARSRCIFEANRASIMLNSGATTSCTHIYFEVISLSTHNTHTKMIKR